jgi:hypothetical protein
MNDPLAGLELRNHTKNYAIKDHPLPSRGPMPIYIQQLTYEDRAVYGTCPVCSAQPGEPCDMSQGIPLDVPTELSDTGTHTARLINAPTQAAISTESAREVSNGSMPNS